MRVIGGATAGHVTKQKDDQNAQENQYRPGRPGAEEKDGVHDVKGDDAEKHCPSPYLVLFREEKGEQAQGKHVDQSPETKARIGRDERRQSCADVGKQFEFHRWSQV